MPELALVCSFPLTSTGQNDLGNSLPFEKQLFSYLITTVKPADSEGFFENEDAERCGKIL